MQLLECELYRLHRPDKVNSSRIVYEKWYPKSFDVCNLQHGQTIIRLTSVRRMAFSFPTVHRKPIIHAVVNPMTYLLMIIL